MPLDLKNITLPPKNVVLRPGSLRYCFTVAGLVLLCAAAAVSQKSSNSGSPKYDRQTEMKTLEWLRKSMCSPWVRAKTSPN